MVSVKELRGKMGLTQKQFAEKYDIPLSTLQHWEQGFCTPPDYVISLIQKVVKTEGFDTDDLQVDISEKVEVE